MKKQVRHSHIEALLKNMPPGYPVAQILVNGAVAEGGIYSHSSNGRAYFQSGGQVAVYDICTIDGILFGVADAAGEEEEEVGGIIEPCNCKNHY
ncbi:hypothetical protein [Mesobacillus foraminis]|uniref:hypothetical protein n=1 Tax=Mesobacillus foraminis TaxID=279826 RepID=UPI000EF43CED|nr:hypothetical protein [Mesobacillus foraminis]